MLTKSALPTVLLALTAMGADGIATKAQSYPPGFPREGATKILENDRVVVWDATWHKGKPTPLHEHTVDYLSVTLVQGTVKVIERDGTSNSASVPLGFVRFNPRGIVHVEEGISDQERRAIMVELKDTAVRPAPIPDDLPGMFPRDGATQLIDNQRVTVWDATWTPARRIGPYHQHRAALIVFLRGGIIRLEERGTVTAVRRAFGEVVYAPAGSDVRSEEARDGGVRAVFIELK